MKKAMMYLLLALGITLFVMFVGGAIGGFFIGLMVIRLEFLLLYLIWQD